MDNKNERFPLVDETGNVLGSITRGEAHDGSKKLHPVVHLHLFNSKGELYLQKRPNWKDIQPGKWDTACGGHVDFGEDIATALHREVHEELGVDSYKPIFIKKYVFESARERELVHVFTATYDGEVKPSSEELDGGRFWSIDAIQQNIGNNSFTPNFEQEFTNTLLRYIEGERELTITPIIE